MITIMIVHKNDTRKEDGIPQRGREKEEEGKDRRRKGR